MGYMDLYVLLPKPVLVFIPLSMLMSLFFMVLACLSITTMATPLSAVSTMWSLSLLSSLRAMFCALVGLGLGGVRTLGLC